MFLPKTELHTQLEAWEREVERAWDEVVTVKAELMRLAGELRLTKKSHKSLEGHAQALEEACSHISREGKTNGDTKSKAGKKGSERQRKV
jgi:chromosome segregation ATPase